MGNPALNGNDAGENTIGAANVARLHQVETFPAGGTFTREAHACHRRS